MIAFNEIALDSCNSRSSREKCDSRNAKVGGEPASISYASGVLFDDAVWANHSVSVMV